MCGKSNLFYWKLFFELITVGSDALNDRFTFNKKISSVDLSDDLKNHHVDVTGRGMSPFHLGQLCREIMNFTLFPISEGFDVCFSFNPAQKQHSTIFNYDTFPIARIFFFTNAQPMCPSVALTTHEVNLI